MCDEPAYQTGQWFCAVYRGRTLVKCCEEGHATEQEADACGAALPARRRHA
jgi:hypothetical protein